MVYTTESDPSDMVRSAPCPVFFLSLEDVTPLGEADEITQVMVADCTPDSWVERGVRYC